FDSISILDSQIHRYSQFDSFIIYLSKSFDHAGPMSVIETGKQRTRLEVFQKSCFYGMRIFRIQIESAHPSGSVVTEIGKRHQHAKPGPAQSAAVIQLKLIFRIEFISKMCSREKIGIISVVIHFLIFESGGNIRMFYPQSDLI